MATSLIRLSESPPARAIASIRGALFSPLVTGSLLLALIAAPEELRHTALKRLAISPDADLTIAKTVLKVLLGLGVLRYLNNKLSSLAQNSWSLTPVASWDWPQELAVVTGGSSGIGAIVVERLTKRQVKVAIFDIQEPPKNLRDDPLVKFYKCDVTKPESVAKSADALRRELGHPSILINNAGITKPMSILDMPQDFLAKIFSVNCMSHWTTVQQFLPRMIQVNKGHVVTVASIASFVALGNAADYSATKAAALAFHESLSSEIRHIYKAPGILTSVIHPNFVRTPLVSEFVDTIEQTGLTLLKPEEVADAITNQVFSKRGAQLVVPERMTHTASFRSLPTWLQILIRNTVTKNAATM